MQEHVAKHLRLSLLLWLLLLALVFPYAVGYYERQQAFQWEKMVQPHWEVVSSTTVVDATGQAVSDDKIEQQNLAALPVEDVQPESPPQKTVADVTPVEAAPVQAVPVQAAPVQAAPVQAAAVEEKPAKKTAPRKKNNPLHFNLPEDLYQNQAAEWHEKKPLEVPDFFAPKKESPNRVQLGGRLIIDEDKKKQQPDVDYLDTVKGAEVNISISTQ